MPAVTPSLRRLPTDYERVWMGYSGSGGLARLRDVLQQMARWSDIRASGALLRRVRQGSVIVFPLRHELWLPNFQFIQDASDVLPGVAEAVGELQYALDAVDIALWFCTPNAWLQDQAPMHAVASAPQAVQAAARADRFVATG